MASIPLYFVRSGYIANIRITVASNDGLYWPSSSASNVWGNTGRGAYFLNLYATGINPSNGPADRGLGFPLRGLDNGGGYPQNGDYLGHLMG